VRLTRSERSTTRAQKDIFSSAVKLHQSGFPQTRHTLFRLTRL
jgi:hypothetical protein